MNDNNVGELKSPTGDALGELLAVKVPKVRNRSGQGINFNSRSIPPYLKRTKNHEDFIPWL